MIEAPPQERATTPYSFADVPALCAGLRSGNESAFRFLHEQWNTRILRYCFALAAGNEALAMDCVQATYLRIFKQLRSLPDEAALWHWIALAARSAAADLHRVGGRYRRALQRFTDWLQHSFGRARENPGESQLFSALDRALAALDAEERFLVEARYFRRAPLEEIAGELSLSVRAVEGRLARTRDRLREKIAAALRDESL